MFMVFMVPAMVLFSSLLAAALDTEDISFAFSHWVTAERMGIISAPITIRKAPAWKADVMMLKGASAMFNPRK